MADYHALLSFRVPLDTEAERIWMHATIANPPEALRVDGTEEDGPVELSFESSFDTESVNIWTTDGCYIEEIAQLLMLFLEQDCCSHKTLGFEYAYVCSKPRTDGFGGGAVRLRKGERENLNTRTFLEEWKVP